MAQSGKINSKRFERVILGRKENTRPLRQYYLIVCEGERTEPLYFQALINDLLPNPQMCEVIGEGRVTLSLVERALEIRNNIEQNTTRVIDHLWVVFDYDNDKHFNAAIQKCEAENKAGHEVKAAFTNEAFELWFLLHFYKHESSLKRDQYKKKISEAITKASGKKFEYKKKDPNIYALLKQYGNRDKAIEHAKNLIVNWWTTRKDYAKHNPRTHVHLLLEELLPSKKKGELES